MANLSNSVNSNYTQSNVGGNPPSYAESTMLASGSAPNKANNTIMGTISRTSNEFSSKFSVDGLQTRSNGMGRVKVTFNCNSDVTLPPFRARDLKIEYSNWATDGTGFQKFEADIGPGYIYLKTSTGLVISGEIEGGPGDQSLGGSGTWLSS